VNQIAKKLSYKLRPYLEFSLPQKEEDPHTIYIYDDNTKSKDPIENRSKLIQVLGEPVKIRRTYVKRDKKDILIEYLQNKHPDLK